MENNNFFERLNGGQEPPKTESFGDIFKDELKSNGISFLLALLTALATRWAMRKKRY